MQGECFRQPDSAEVLSSVRSLSCSTIINRWKQVTPVSKTRRFSSKLFLNRNLRGMRSKYEHSRLWSVITFSFDKLQADERKWEERLNNKKRQKYTRVEIRKPVAFHWNEVSFYFIVLFHRPKYVKGNKWI